MLASSPDLAPHDPLQSLATLLVAFVTGMALVLLEARGIRLPRPAITLRPWDYPVGLVLFISITFVAASAWGALISLTAAFPGLSSSLYFLALGAGVLLAICVAPRLFPHKFKPAP